MSNSENPNSNGASSAIGIGFLPPGVDSPPRQKKSQPPPPYKKASGDDNNASSATTTATGAGKKGKKNSKTILNESDVLLEQYALQHANASSSSSGNVKGNGSKGGKGKKQGNKNTQMQLRNDAFCRQFEPNFYLPQRLFSIPSPLIEAVNDFHFAMMNDRPRNEFYYRILKKQIVPGQTGVLEIGAGSGLLSMMAAKLGAKWVVAVEGSPEMSQLAKKNIVRNNLQDKVTVLNMLSTELTPQHLPEKPDIVVSEILGTLLLGESALDYLLDVRTRGKSKASGANAAAIVKPTTRFLPARGAQYAVPISCEALKSISSVSDYDGIDLTCVNELQDTASVVFTKKYGFRLSTVPFTRLCAPLTIVDIDFEKTQHSDLKSEVIFDVVATESGPAHAIMFYWEVHSEVDAEDATATTLTMSTAPEANIDNFPRDMQWGQALQLLDDGSNSASPVTPVFEKGCTYRFMCHLSQDHVVVQLQFMGKI